MFPRKKKLPKNARAPMSVEFCGRESRELHEMFSNAEFPMDLREGGSKSTPCNLNQRKADSLISDTEGGKEKSPRFLSYFHIKS
jgi:hypothetical protein